MAKLLARNLLVATLAVALSGCGAHFNSIHRDVALKSNRPSMQLIDAKQRAIITVPGRVNYTDVTTENNALVRTQKTAPQLLFCAEPHPDVFSVFAAAASGNGSFGQSGAPGALELALGFSASSSEQGSTIGRTQTVNLLKEVMYRTCERYINGGMGQLELATQASRDQRLIVATLAIEQLTGAILPKPIIIGAAGAAGGGGSAAAAIVALDEAWKAKEAAAVTKGKAEAAYEELNSQDGGKVKICDAFAAGTTVDPKYADKKDACSALGLTRTKASKAADEQLGRYNTMKSALDSGGGLVTQASTTVQAASGDGALQQANSSDIAEVAQVVREIVADNYAVDEFELLCIKVLDKSSGVITDKMSEAGTLRFPNNPVAVRSIEDSCIAYFNQKIEQARAKSEASVAESEYRLSMTRIARDDLTLFQQFWALAPDVRQARIAAAIAKGGADIARLRQLQQAQTSAAAADIFAQLGDVARRRLLTP
jgi:hypothetical protein